MPLGAARINTLAKLQAIAADPTQAHRALTEIILEDNSVVSTTQSKFGGSSFYFDGNNDGVSVHPRNLQIGSGDFTIELFYYPTSLTAGNRLILDCRDNNTDPNRINWYFDSATTYQFRQGSTTILSGAHGMSTNQWYHLAIVRSSGTTKFYRDGTEIHSASDSTTYASDNFIIGQYFAGGNFGLIGYVDEVRVSNTARYTGSFTPTTTVFTNDINTNLLLHADGVNNSIYAIDDGGDRARVGVIANGDAKVGRGGNTKFNGSAILFDGTGDYLSTPAISLSGDYTIEAWIRPDTVASGTASTIIGGNTTSSYESLQVSEDDVSWNTPFLVANSAISANTWHHVAVSRSGSSVKLFVDGTEEASGTDSSTVFSDDTNLYIGRDAFTSAYTDGYMDEIRISSTARYTSGFSTPTKRFTSDDDTLLLIHGLGTTSNQNFYDDNSSARYPLSTAQNTSASGFNNSYSKFDNTSIYFDGSGDYVFAKTENGELDFGTDDFTIEWFQYLPSLTNNYNAVDLRNGANGAKILLYSNPTDSWQLWVNNASRINTGSVLTASTWQHICLCRESGSTRIYVDGTQYGATYSDSTNYQHESIYIFYNSLSSAYDANGYLNEFRISDVARYSGGSLTVPTAPFKNDSNTRLLIHGTGTPGSAYNNWVYDDNSAFTE